MKKPTRPFAIVALTATLIMPTLSLLAPTAAMSQEDPALAAARNCNAPGMTMAQLKDCMTTALEVLKTALPGQYFNLLERGLSEKMTQAVNPDSSGPDFSPDNSTPPVQDSSDSSTSSDSQDNSTPALPDDATPSDPQ